MASSVVDLITQTAQSLGVDPALAIEVARAESNFNQNAVSPAGAIGVYQLEPDTAAQLGVDPNDLTQNISGGIKYLAMMLSQFGTIPAALAAYNWGEGNLSNAIAKYGSSWVNHLPTETVNYIAKITANLAQYTATITPASVANGVTQMLTTPAASAPDDSGATPPASTSSSLVPIAILTALGILALIGAEVFSDD